jgi:hypothetical protein
VLVEVIGLSFVVSRQLFVVKSEVNFKPSTSSYPTVRLTTWKVYLIMNQTAVLGSAKVLSLHLPRPKNLSPASEINPAACTAPFVHGVTTNKAILVDIPALSWPCSLTFVTFDILESILITFPLTLALSLALHLAFEQGLACTAACDGACLRCYP